MRDYANNDDAGWTENFGTDPTNNAAGWCMRKTWQISAVALGYRFCNVRHLWRKMSRFAARKKLSFSFRTPHISGLKCHEDYPGLARSVPRRSCLSSSCQGSHENSRFEVFRPLSCGQVLPCLPLRQLWGCRNGKWALGEWSINHTVLAWRARCIYLFGLFKFKGNPNPPGDCGLDGLRSAFLELFFFTWKKPPK